MRPVPRARRVPVPSGLVADEWRVDYQSAFAVDQSFDLSAQQWAQAVFADAPALVRGVLWVGWRFVLGLRLRPPGTPGFVRGWPVVATSDRAITMRAESWMLTAWNLSVVEDDVLTWVSAVRYRNWLGAALWGLAALVHHRTLPLLLQHAAQSEA